MQLAATVDFPGLSQPVQHLSRRDKIELFAWGDADAPPGIGSVVLYDSVNIGPVEFDFVLVHGADTGSAPWGLAREGDRIRLWRCGEGCLLGLFESMQQALGAIASCASIKALRLHYQRSAPARSTERIAEEVFIF